MTTPTPQPGELWTVPAAGPDALVLILSEVGVASSGAPDFQGVGARRHHGGSARAFVDELVLEAGESVRGTLAVVELWNLRPLLVEQLGERVDALTSEPAFDAIWDAYIRMADPALHVDHARYGMQVPSPAIIAERHDQLARWHSLSMQGCARSSRVRFDLAAGSTFSLEDQVLLTDALSVDAELTRHYTFRAGHHAIRVLTCTPDIAPQHGRGLTVVGALMPSRVSRIRSVVLFMDFARELAPAIDQAPDLTSWTAFSEPVCIGGGCP